MRDVSPPSSTSSPGPSEARAPHAPTPATPGPVHRAAARLLSDPDRRVHVPGTSASFGPPRRHATSLDLHGRHGVRTTVVVEAGPPAVPSTTWHGRGPSAQAAGYGQATVPAQTVTTIPDARVVLPHGWVIGPDDTLVTDLLFGWERPHLRTVQRLPHARPAATLAGHTVSLLSDWATTNWSHFLLEAMSRRHLLQGAGVHLATADRVLVPGLASPTAQWLRAVTTGTLRTTVVAPTDTRTVHCELLTVAGFPGSANNMPTWLGPHLRSLVPVELEDRVGPPVFVARRGGVRPLAEEAELAERMAGLGFDVIEAGRGRADVAAFATAPLVVAPHGAAMANVGFCRPGTVVFELLPPTQEIPVFASLCASAGLHHHALVGTPAAGRPGTAFDVSVDGWHVDVDEVMAVTQDLLAHACVGSGAGVGAGVAAVGAVLSSPARARRRPSRGTAA